MKRQMKIITAIILSFVAVIIMAPRVFLANTPRINPIFLTNLKNFPSTLAGLPSVLFNNFFQRGANERYAKVYKQPFYKINDEVYAYEEGNILYYDLKSGSGNYKEMNITTNSGKTIKLRFPESEPPVKEIIDLIKSQ